MPKCDKLGCAELATQGKYNYREVPTHDQQRWRQFERESQIMNGCDAHVPISKTFYLDGRVVFTDQTMSEKCSRAEWREWNPTFQPETK